MDKTTVRAGAVASCAGAVSEQSTPVSLTGVERTHPGGLAVTDAAGSSVVLDWLTLTLTGIEIERALEVVTRHFGEIISQEGRGFLGYHCSGSILAGKGRVAWDDTRPDMGVCVSLSSSALGEIGRSCDDVRSWLAGLVNEGFKPTRCDLALDDKAGLLDFAVIVQAVDNGAYTSRFQSWELTRGEKRGRKGGDRRKQTKLTFGCRQSESYLRFYDKGAFEGQAAPWVRCEIEFKGKRAGAALIRLIGEGPAWVGPVVKGYLDFKEIPAGEDSNKRRWPSAAWWRAFVGATKDLLKLPLAERTLEGVKAWAVHTWPKAAALLCLSEGDAGWFFDLVAQGADRLGPLDLALLDGSKAGPVTIGAVGGALGGDYARNAS